MNLAVWAERNGVAWVIAYRWFRAGLLPVPAQRVGRLILVNDPAVEESGRGRTLVYARVSSADQRSDLDRRGARGPRGPHRNISLSTRWWPRVVGR
ncbi:resolvase [Mycobacterium tuberculosis]|nr:resolvase [Mycobacterium tuberculosis]